MMETQSNEQPRLIIYHAGQCDPKKCTGHRLSRFKITENLKDMRRIPRGATVLNPVSDVAFSKADRDSVLRTGLVALDCSWKQAEDIFRRSKYGRQRALPYLLAANPINTYKPIKLSTAEAMASALYIAGLEEMAERIMSVFKWGPSFLILNKEWLDAYSLCDSSTEVVSTQREIMESHQRKQE
jgi:pre-rRNA-processing protein TSR3